ncbi:MAG: alpha/beta hydrolase [Chloroflexi bacterium]|nr:alpha/beta hydrolase [Chloroflexota bacterium]
MGNFEQITVTLQSGTPVSINAWPGSDAAQAIIIAGPGTSAEQWSKFAAQVVPSHSPVLADVSSSRELLLLIWEIGEPVMLLSQGEVASAWVSEVVSMAPGAVTALAICDGYVPTSLIGTAHAVPTLILRGRQSKLQSHEGAVQLHGALPNSKLIEPENCGDFPAFDNPDSAAAALNLFIAESGGSIDNFAASEPVDPKS